MSAQHPCPECGDMHQAAWRIETGMCWFCKGEFVVDALIAGYDTWEESRLACLACNERMSGNWRPIHPSEDGAAPPGDGE